MLRGRRVDWSEWASQELGGSGPRVDATGKVGKMRTKGVHSIWQLESPSQ